VPRFARVLDREEAVFLEVPDGKCVRVQYDILRGPTHANIETVKRFVLRLPQEDWDVRSAPIDALSPYIRWVEIDGPAGTAAAGKSERVVVTDTGYVWVRVSEEQFRAILAARAGEKERTILCDGDATYVATDWLARELPETAAEMTRVTRVALAALWCPRGTGSHAAAFAG
jgi:hypothetical protein